MRAQVFSVSNNARRHVSSSPDKETAKMDERKDASQTDLSRLDLPSASIPSVDRSWEDTRDREARDSLARRDLSQHRVYHSLYEDMLN